MALQGRLEGAVSALVEALEEMEVHFVVEPQAILEVGAVSQEATFAYVAVESLDAQEPEESVVLALVVNYVALRGGSEFQVRMDDQAVAEEQAKMDDWATEAVMAFEEGLQFVVHLLAVQ